MNKAGKIILSIVIPQIVLIGLIVFIGYKAVNNVKGTIDFGTEREAREQVAIQRLSDIRELEKAYYNRYGVYQDTFAVLKAFYETGSLAVTFENGSLTDSLATLMTDKIKAEILKNYEKKRIKFGKTELERKNDSLNISLYRDYYLQDTVKYKDLQFKVPVDQPVHTQLFADRKDFCIDSLEFIPFSHGKKIVYWTHVEDDETGSSVPVYEVKIPYEDLLYGLDENEIRSWCKERLKFDHDLPKGPRPDDVFTKDRRVMKWADGTLGTVLEVVNDTTRVDEKHFTVALRSLRVRFDDKTEEEYLAADAKKITTDTLHCYDQRVGLQIGGDYEFSNGNGNWK